ncbi:predicted protein [Naegleria gruberi]|uniref:Predicted protein n=1 Tax=Naegleria gruberi TaxID=5762 RepID=D2VWB1_NAEGR|nr:uncharacterized protein NAEGRDRAFT_73319 [Naegleria gruberi]EFC38802.1 predicted protein [Naegleria gruberi]|eukprot:XP_002671546.1 predicted protein [Naegleria gruberi strain NEG-M]
MSKGINKSSNTKKKTNTKTTVKKTNTKNTVKNTNTKNTVKNTVKNTNKKNTIKKKNPKLAREVVNYTTVNAKWFLYAPTTTESGFKATFIPVSGPFNRVEEMKRVACLQMFCESCAITLGFYLDPSMFKRFQTGIRIASLKPEWFSHYFESCGGKMKNRVQYIRYNGHSLSITCPSYEFYGLENMPPLNCNGSYASTVFQVSQPILMNHPFQPHFKWIEQWKFVYRLYFSKLVFICNPVTNMVSVDLEFTKDVQSMDCTGFQIV